MSRYAFLSQALPRSMWFQIDNGKHYIVQGDRPHKVTEVVVFKPTAIKHKDAKRFDPNDPNIYHARGGVAK